MWSAVLLGEPVAVRRATGHARGLAVRLPAAAALWEDLVPQRERCVALRSTHLDFWRQRLAGATLGPPVVLPAEEPRLLDIEPRLDKMPLYVWGTTIAYVQENVAAGRPVVINCAQGKSRSGTAAAAYVMASRDLDVESALAVVRAKRPMVEPNPGFMRCLKSHEAAIRVAGRSGDEVKID